jgi:hypothetical protein
VHQGADLGRQVRLELGVADFEVVQQLLGQRLDVVLVHQSIDQLECPPSDGHVRVLDALHDGGPMPLDRLSVNRHNVHQSIQGHVSEGEGETEVRRFDPSGKQGHLRCLKADLLAGAQVLEGETLREEVRIFKRGNAAAVRLD